jgi:alcohol dehydrogenase class IV
MGISRISILTLPEIRPVLEPLFGELRKEGIDLAVDESIRTEPGFRDFFRVFDRARDFSPELVLGIGGGSVLDVAKVVAAQLDNARALEEFVGINLLSHRTIKLACLPTTAGTGSEVSPNAILLDEDEQLKKGIISPYLVPDMVYIDPELTLSVPPAITAATGIDAFTHCLEAYVNKHAHPMIDAYALEGMRMIIRSLEKAIQDPADLLARSDLALGSMWGGMCLGPVNTTAIHALSYPLGSEFHVAHGLSNALLLPYVMEYNLPVAENRYAEVGDLFGSANNTDRAQRASRAIQAVRELIHRCGLPARLSAIDIPEDAIPRMAGVAMKIQRLLVNNPREVKLEDAIGIYQKAY